MDNLPEPMVPEACDLRDFPFTPIFRARLFGSEFHARASDGGWRAGVTLWLKSWDQVPAGSLPDDDVSLCRLAELGRDRRAWAKVKDEALHGWVKCSDGRLYHPVVAEGVTEAWARKLAQRERTAAARAAREAKRKEEAARVSGGSDTGSDNAPCDATTDTATTSVTDAVTASKGQGQGQGQGQVFKKKEEDIPPLSETPTGGASEASGTSTPSPAELTAPGGVQPPEWDDETVAYLRRNSRETAESVRAVLIDLGKSHGRDEIGAAIDQARCSTATKPLAFVGAHLARLRAASPLASTPDEPWKRLNLTRTEWEAL
ncbi:hypothetical protein KL86APRO_30168 [uncultured Alphaproteobacteria bacterium]|uniref:DUF1376 domain-containing protein n=1 Tax=uncultured Alphaproteobacteria bacterium TaxID=91750 RepID=A0A212KLY4_9PROT|nr:hypothetical protein KL86APRO_30168 [uncultured Alphaproteobacteria bacterium]